MSPADEYLPLDYTPQWIALGIVTVEDIQRDQHAASTSEDSHPEHYRWRAFSRFFSMQPALSSSLARQLYALVGADADASLGGSIMVAVLRHPDCPDDLLRSALTSEHSYLQRAAAQRLHSSQ